MNVEIVIDSDVYLDCYHHLINSEADINFLWGGRDSGKSVFVAQKLITDCLEKPYFRFILIKKTYESIKDSQFQTIKDIVYEWNLEQFFTFRESPLEIECVNGNKFIARGCDKPEKLKSIKDPSGAWYEEGNQLSEEDYDTVSTTLRTNKARIQEWFTFNPEFGGNYEDFWLEKRFISGQPYNTHTEFTREITINKTVMRVRCTSTHTDYTHNPYVSDERKARHELLKITNPYRHTVFTLGHRGKPEVKRAWVRNYDEARHKSKTPLMINPNYELRFSQDFNVDPMAGLMCQIWQDREGHHVRILRQHKHNDAGTETLIQDLKATYTPAQLAMCLFTGDETGNQRRAEQKIVNFEHLTNWKIIDKALHLGGRLQLPRRNPTHVGNRELVSTILALHPDFLIDPSCLDLINDILTVEADDEGGILKTSSGKEKQKSHFLDCLRYICNTWLSDFVDNPNKYLKK